MLLQYEFLETFADKAADVTMQQGRSALCYNDLAATVAITPTLDFLGDIIPQKLTVSEALERSAPP